MKYGRILFKTDVPIYNEDGTTTTRKRFMPYNIHDVDNFNNVVKNYINIELEEIVAAMGSMVAFDNESPSEDPDSDESGLS